MKKNILITGSSGLIGTALLNYLTKEGYGVFRLKRSKVLEVNEFFWDPSRGEIDKLALKSIDVVVHLAGEPIAQRWSPSAKKRIVNSRVNGTRLLAETIAQSQDLPRLICASGINYYGDQSDGFVDESSPQGLGFLAEVCRQWESAANPAIEAGARVVFMRTGVVLSRHGGALAKMLPFFKAGLGGRIGDGKQLMSWISLSDLVKAYTFVLEDDAANGALNAVAPDPVTNTSFTQILGNTLGIPTIFPIPRILLKVLYGEMGKETALASLSVQPARLKDLGFEWTQSDLRTALRAILRNK
ncbi:MAG: TIGR01777 family oxidoreductase [Verrucomicrobiota bacterium]|nr:TIGR01777 family oxidoreductase [Verrucomicrobiota bacterium]